MRSAGASLSTARPVRADTLTRCAHADPQQVPVDLAVQLQRAGPHRRRSHLLKARTRARPASITIGDDALVLLGQRLRGIQQDDRHLGVCECAAPCAGSSSTRRRWPRAPGAEGRPCRRSARSPRPGRQGCPPGRASFPRPRRTSARSCRASRFSRLDLPTFGRPSSATRRGPAGTSNGSAGASGSAASTASSTSPLPRPWIALTGNGSPRPSDHNSRPRAPAVRRQSCWPPGPRACRIAGGPGRPHGRPRWRPRWRRPRTARRRQSRPRAAACSATFAARPLACGSQPPVSTTVNWPPAPRGVVGHPVPGHPRDVLDDGEPAPENPIDQRRLADVGAADDSDDRSDGNGVGGRVVVSHLLHVSARRGDRRPHRCRGRWCPVRRHRPPS